MATFLRTLRLLHNLPKTSITGIAIHRISTTSAMYQPRSLVKMKQLQAKYQCEDGKPIFLKGGFHARVLYIATLGLALFGLCMCLLTIYEHAKPVSWKTEPIC